MSKSIDDMENYLIEMADELNALSAMDQMEMYRNLTDLGNSMEVLPESEKTEENFVHGCTSNVYISETINNKTISYKGSSESHVVRGYVAILVEALSGLQIDDLLEASQKPIEQFAENTNIRATLTPSRANAFGNIYKLMREKAQKAS